MGAVEMTFSQSPAISDWSSSDWRIRCYSDALQGAIARVVLPETHKWDRLSNAAIGSPLIVTYERVQVLIPEVEDAHGDLDELLLASPLKVVGKGRAQLKPGKLPDVEWEL